MKFKSKLLYGKWMLIFTILLGIELLIELVPIFMPTLSVFKYVSLVGFLVAMLLIFFLLKGMEKTTEELRKNKQRLKRIFDSLDVAIWSHDIKTDTLLVTPGIEKLYGYSLEDFYENIELWKKVIDPDDLPSIAERQQRTAAGEDVTNVYRIIRPDGEVRWIRDSGFPTLDSQGNLIEFSSVLFDITEQKESEDRYRSLVEMSSDIIAVIYKGKIEYINERGSKLLGANTPEEVIGQSVWQFAPMEIYDEFMKVDSSALQGNGERVRIEFQLNQIDGSKIIVEVSAMPILFGGREAIQIIGRDITERKKAEETIKTMAYYDSLTGLPNRNKFRLHLNNLLGRQKDTMMAVLFLDLDRFKIINDTRGHTAGDRLLQKVAERLQESVQNDGMVSRQGGDEFIILLENTSKEKAGWIAQKIIDEFMIEFELGSLEVFVTSSIGISLYPTDGTDVETLIKKADTAMYQAKERGKNNFQFYSCQLNKLSLRKVELENELRKAMEQNQLQIYYQPQVELATGKIVGVEALARWIHPVLGSIPPSEFIPLAEESGLIVPIGKWVLRTACAQNKAWQDAGFAPIVIAVNISVRQFQDDHFVDSVISILDQTGLDAKFLELEITESFMQNISESTTILNQLKERGISFSIDDFGTGYSSLSYLRHLPVDKLKIDKSFVDDINDDFYQGTMVKTIIDMGTNLEFTVIAEGIENEKQVEFLKQKACLFGQGYFFSAPVKAEQMETYLQTKKRRIPIY